MGRRPSDDPPQPPQKPKSHLKFIGPVKDKDAVNDVCQKQIDRKEAFIQIATERVLSFIERTRTFTYREDDPQLWTTCRKRMLYSQECVAGNNSPVIFIGVSHDKKDEKLYYLHNGVNWYISVKNKESGKYSIGPAVEFSRITDKKLIGLLDELHEYVTDWIKQYYAYLQSLFLFLKTQEEGELSRANTRRASDYTGSGIVRYSQPIADSIVPFKQQNSFHRKELQR